MSILSGFKRFKDYIKTDEGYILGSRWTGSDSVIMGDGTDDTNTLEKNCGAIHGITDSLTSESSNVAASAKAVKEVNDSLAGLSFAQDTKGNWGYIPSGADTVIPFKNMKDIAADAIIDNITVSNGAWNSTGTGQTTATYTVPSNGILKIKCTDTYQRTANQNVAHSNTQWRVVTHNNTVILNTQNGDSVRNTDLVFEVNANDTIRYIYYVKWVSGDALYYTGVVSMASVLLCE